MHFAEAGVGDGVKGGGVVLERVAGGLDSSVEVGRGCGVELLAAEAVAEGAGLGDAEGGEVGFGVAAEATFDVAVGLGVADDEELGRHREG